MQIQGPAKRRGGAFRTLIAAGAVGLGALIAPGFAPVFATEQEDADALFAAQEWAGAAAAYDALLQEDAANPNNWFSLAQARHQLEDFAGARDAYRKALDAGYQPAGGRARFHLARALMSLGQKKAALTALEELAKSGGPNYRVVQNAAAFAALADEPRFQAVLEALKPCRAEEHRQFDFWIGHWDVTAAGAPTPTAENKISSLQDGCVLLEQYSSGGGAYSGTSLNFYDANSKKWRQTWMSNSPGGALYLEGGLSADGAMVMSDKDLPSSAASGTINKIAWTPSADGSVRQLWQTSSDGGATWSVVFDGRYVKKAETP